MTNVLLAEHRPIVQLGLQTLLNEQKDLTLVDTVNDCSQLLRLIRQRKPTVILLNVNLPNLQVDEFVNESASYALETSLLFLLEPGQEAQIDLHKLLQQGVGAILSDEPTELWVAALRTLGKGESWSSQRLLFKLIKAERKRLTPQELTVLRQSAMGLTNKGIAQALSIAERTVEFHLSNIFQKLHVSSRLEAVLWFKTQNFPNS